MFGQKNWYAAKPYGCLPSRRWGRGAGSEWVRNRGAVPGWGRGPGCTNKQQGQRLLRHPGCPHACQVASCLTLCDPMDTSPPGSSVRGILQARILEWVAIPFSRGSSRPRDGTRVSYVSCVGRRVLYHCRHLGSPQRRTLVYK